MGGIHINILLLLPLWCQVGECFLRNSWIRVWFVLFIPRWNKRYSWLPNGSEFDFFSFLWEWYMPCFVLWVILDITQKLRCKHSLNTNIFQWNRWNPSMFPVWKHLITWHFHSKFCSNEIKIHQNEFQMSHYHWCKNYSSRSKVWNDSYCSYRSPNCHITRWFRCQLLKGCLAEVMLSRNHVICTSMMGWYQTWLQLLSREEDLWFSWFSVWRWSASGN